MTLTGHMKINDDGTYESADKSEVKISIVIPKACLGGAKCADAGAVEQGDNCVIDQTETEDTEEAGTYSLKDNTITFVHEGEETQAEYCTDGDKMTVHINEEGVDIYLSLTR